MKRIASLAILFVLWALPGCKTVGTNQPLAPGYENAADQQMGGILSGARTFYSTIQCETKGMNWSQPSAQCVTDPTVTTLVLSDTAKKAFNDFGATLNAASSVYLAYHAGTATEAAAQTAVNNVKTQQAALPIPGAK